MKSRKIGLNLVSGVMILFNEYRDVLTVEELCEMLDIGKNAAYKLLASGKIHCFRHNRVWKIPKEGVVEYIRQQSTMGRT